MGARAVNKADISRRNGAARRRKKMNAIAAEFGEPFWSVVQGFADMGCGKHETAGAIGYDPSAFCRLVRDEGQHIRWPDYADLRAWQDRYYPPDWRKRCSEGRRRSGKRLQTVVYQGVEMLQRDYARAAGISEGEAWRRRVAGRVR